MHELEAAASEARAALDAWTRWLKDELLPTATGDFRLTPELYRAKYRLKLRTTAPPEELKARAEAELSQVRSLLLRL